MTVKTAAEGGFEVRRDELDWTAMDEATRVEFEELFGASDTVTVDPRALERKFTIPERNRAIGREFRPASRDWATLDENGRIVPTAKHDTRSARLGLRFEAWLGEQRFDAEQARWAGLIGSRIRADAMTVESFWDYDLDSHPFTGLGGYDQAVRVFGGRDALELVLGSLNVAVFDDNGPDTPTRADDRPTT